MGRISLFLVVALIGSVACRTAVGETPVGAARTQPPSQLHPAATTPQPLPAYQPRFARKQPVIAIVGENFYTELTDYVLPYGILAESGVAEVWALATQPGPIRMFPAPLKVEPQATTAAFDSRYPDGADYVVVPAVHRDDDPALISWVTAQARKGATIVGVCDGVWVLAHAGLLQGRQATGHWYAMDDLRKKFPHTAWQSQRRYVADGKVVTTTGVTATIPVSFALIEAIAGRERAVAVAIALGGGEVSLSASHASDSFQFAWRHKFTVARNFLAFWAHEDVGIAVAGGVDEIALALQAEAYSATFRSKAYTVAQQAGPLKTRRGLTLLPDRLAGPDAPRRMLAPTDPTRPLKALDHALKGIEADYGQRTAAWVALQLEYIGN